MIGVLRDLSEDFQTDHVQKEWGTDGLMDASG